MFLKNESEFTCGLRTKSGNITIRKGEVIHVFEGDLLETNEYLTVATEAEYEAFKNEAKSDIPEECKGCYTDGRTPSVDMCEKCKVVVPVKEEVKEVKSEEVVGVKVEEITEEVKEDKVDEPTPLVENTTKIKTAEDEIEELKNKWAEAKTAAEKAKITKLIKKLQGK